MDIQGEIRERLGEGVSLNNLGLVYKALGKNEEALKYYGEALCIRKEVGDRLGEGTTLWNLGALYFDLSRYNVALAFFLLARDIFKEILSPNSDKVQNWIDRLRRKVGEQRFTTLLAQVEPQAQQIVEQALHENTPHV